jgi:asparagine synthase (glutamine-hydrolysing)
MFRYIALLRLDDSSAARDAYHRASERATALHPEFFQAYQTEAIRLLFAGTVPGRIRIHSLGESGVLIGTLFHAAGGANGPTASLSAAEVEEVVASRGEVLVRRHWGHYVALMRPTDDTWRVMRDPTGGLPCYCVCSHRIALIFSNLDDCTTLLPKKLSINYSHLHAFLHLHRFVPRDTGFNEVEVIQAGEAADLRRGAVTRTFLWDPASFCSSPADYEDVAENVATMREVVTKCVWSWAACHRSILHELSGGLDSSIVLACLADAPSAPRLACCTHVTQSPEGDERHYARLMARHVRAPLAELPLRSKAWKRIEDLVRVHNSVSPLFTAFECSEDAEIKGMIEAGSFDCTFSGQGGDHLFLRTLPSITAADYAWVHGLRTPLLRVIVETAHASGQPVWSIARQALQYGFCRRPYDIWRGLRVPSFICAPAIDLSQSCHTWLAERSLLPPAKLLQIMCITETQTYWATPRPYVDEIHPLISQPLLECCLRIPTYILSHGGTDRTIARAAFRNALPAEIVQRSLKGAVTKLFFRSIYDNREWIRPFLLDGLLADRGLLDRPELKKALDDPLSIARGRFLIPIMTATVCEMWLRCALSLTQSVGPSAAGGSLIPERMPQPSSLIRRGLPGRGTWHRGGTNRRASGASGRTGTLLPDRDPPGLRART